MQESKRLSFLKSFLKFYGVEKIELTNETIDSISGIAIFNKAEIEEKQEFIWHKSEIEVPPPELNILIEKIIKEKLHDGDKIFDEIEKLKFSEFDNKTKIKLVDELFDVEIKMVDNGRESDLFFVHS